MNVTRHDQIGEPCSRCGSTGHSTRGHEKIEAAYAMHQPQPINGSLPVHSAVQRVQVTLHDQGIQREYDVPAVVRTYVLGPDLEDEVVTVQFHPHGSIIRPDVITR